MTTGLLKAEIQQEEGLRLEVYPDPVSHAEPYTVGWGHTGPDVHMGDTWTLEACNTALDRDIQKAEDHLDVALPWWRAQDDVRQDVLVDLCFNLGIGNGSDGLTGFHHFLNFCRTGQYEQAADELVNSHWYTEVGDRGVTLVYMMRNGARPT